MPKETVGTPDHNVVDILWGRDPGMVSITTRCPSRLVAATIPAATRADGSSVQSDLGPEHMTVEAQPFTGWYSDLNRYDINRLIQALRRARDQAFGKDA